MQNYSDEELIKILKYPHLLGHLAGKNKLTPLHSEWSNYVWDRKGGFKSLMAFRGAMKSTQLVELDPLIQLAKNPDLRIAIVKKTITAAAESVRTTANLAMMPDVYAFLEDFWGKWKFDALREGKFLLSCKRTKTKEMSLEALGLDSKFTGRHYDIVIFDDVVDLTDRLSEAEREHTKIAVGEFMSNIIDPGGHIICIGTPWHVRDTWSIMPPPAKYSVKQNPDGTWFSYGLLTDKEIEEKRKFITPVLWKANYELMHESDQDQLFLNPRLGAWHTDKVTSVKAHLDAAYDGNHYCALTIMGRLPNNKYNAVGWVFAGNVKDWLPEIAKHLVEYGADTIYIETNADRGYTADMLRMFPEIQRNHVWVEDYDERMKKTEKIGTYAYEVYKDIEWDEKGTDTEYLEQVVDYMPDQEPDDAPDSLASLCRMAGFSATKAWQNNVWDF